jgi:hypothetical protein
VPNADDCGLPRSVKESATILSDNPATLSARSNWKSLLEIAGKKSAARHHEMSGKGL